LALNPELGDVCPALALPLLGPYSAFRGEPPFELPLLKSLLPFLADQGVSLLPSSQGLLVPTLNS
jgi:hypothetical protein